MDDFNTQGQENQIKQEAFKRSSKKFITSRGFLPFILLIIVAFVSAYGTYLWRSGVANNIEKQLNDDVSTANAQMLNLEKQLADLKKAGISTNSDSDNDCKELAPNSATAANIKASITSGNTQALEGYMAPTVNVVLAASEAYGPQSPAQAVSDITNFISTNINSWDYNFSLSPAILSGYQGGEYGQYFSDISIAGKASNNHTISFSFSCDGKIDTVFLLQ